jgi:signal transduction histidine kinase
MIPAQIEPHNEAALALAGIAGRSPLAQLLHALNQPLTGLQCSMEVALAGTRTPEQYRQGLREGLVLTERMRALVEAIREVADGLDTDRLDKDRLDEDRNEIPNEMTDLATILRETVNDLKPVAESKAIRMEMEFDCFLILVVKAGRQRLGGLTFRILDSVLSLAAEGSAVKISTAKISAVKIEAGTAPTGDWLRIQWEANEEARQPSSRPELGLLVAQAGFEHCGAEWQRMWDGKQETLSIRLPRISRKNS